MSDVDEILSHYADRATDARLTNLYTAASPGDVYMMERLHRAVARILRDKGIFPLDDKRILDVGCGSGTSLRYFVDMGADPAKCYGVDINAERLERARYRNSHMVFLESNAECIPIDAEFDLITQFTAFSSMPSAHMRARCADEMLRLLRPNGLILWYDFRVRHPRNRRVTPMTARDVRQLFATCQVGLQSATLAPPVSRRLAPRSEIACLLLEKVPVCRTHYLAMITKQASG